MQPAQGRPGLQPVTPTEEEDDFEVRGLAAMRAYVAGRQTPQRTWDSLRAVPGEVSARVFANHRAELESENPARAVLLESMLPGKHP
jgi:hypothetical protein